MIKELGEFLLENQGISKIEISCDRKTIINFDKEIRENLIDNFWKKGDEDIFYKIVTTDGQEVILKEKEKEPQISNSNIKDLPHSSDSNGSSGRDAIYCNNGSMGKDN